MATQDIDQTQGKNRETALNDRGYSTWKRGLQNRADAWWQTVTHFTPEPWLIARRAADARRLRLMMYGSH